MRRTIPIVVGAILLLIGVGWASQGAGLIGGSSLMDNNSVFVYLGGFLAVLGAAVLALGVFSKPKPPASPAA